MDIIWVFLFLNEYFSSSMKSFINITGSVRNNRFFLLFLLCNFNFTCNLEHPEISTSEVLACSWGKKQGEGCPWPDRPE